MTAAASSSSREGHSMDRARVGDALLVLRWVMPSEILRIRLLWRVRVTRLGAASTRPSPSHRPPTVSSAGVWSSTQIDHDTAVTGIGTTSAPSPRSFGVMEPRTVPVTVGQTVSVRTVTAVIVAPPEAGNPNTAARPTGRSGSRWKRKAKTDADTDRHAFAVPPLHRF